MRRINLLALFGFLGAMVWIFLLPKETTSSFQRGVGSWFSPFTRTGAKVQDAIIGEPESDKSPAELKAAHDAAEIELNELRLRVQRLAAVERDNSDLRAALEFKKRYGLKLIPAEIMNRKQSAWYREATIDKGMDHKIVVQAPVLAAVQVTDGGISRFEGALVGKVGRVDKDFSTIVFVTDENCRVAATVKGMNNVRGILMGARGSTRQVPDLRLRFLKPDQPLEPGRQVLSDGIGGVFPFGILLGEVKDFLPGDGTAEALVRPAVDFDVLKHVFILQPEETPTAAPSTETTKAK